MTNKRRSNTNLRELVRQAEGAFHARDFQAGLAHARKVIRLAKRQGMDPSQELYQARVLEGYCLSHTGFATKRGPYEKRVMVRIILERVRLAKSVRPGDEFVTECLNMGLSLLDELSCYRPAMLVFLQGFDAISDRPFNPSGDNWLQVSLLARAAKCALMLGQFDRADDLLEQAMRYCHSHTIGGMDPYLSDAVTFMLSTTWELSRTLAKQRR